MSNIAYDKHYRAPISSSTTSPAAQIAIAVNTGTAAATVTDKDEVANHHHHHQSTETDITGLDMADMFSEDQQRRLQQVQEDDEEDITTSYPSQTWLDMRKEEQRSYLDSTRGELLSIIKHRGEILDDTVLRNILQLQRQEGVERLATVEIQEWRKREQLFRYFIEFMEQTSGFMEIRFAKHDATLVPWCTNSCRYCCMYRPEWDTHVRVTCMWSGALLEDSETRARESLLGEMVGQFKALISYAGATQLQLQLMDGHTAALYAEEETTRNKIMMIEQVLFYQNYTVRHAEKLQKWQSKQYAQELRDKTLESHRDQQKLQLMHVKAFRQMNLLCTNEEASRRGGIEQLQESKFQDIVNKFTFRFTEIMAHQWRTEVKVALEERDALLEFKEETMMQRSKDYEESQKKQQQELEREFRELRKIRKAGAGDASPPCPRCHQVPARDMTSHRLNECPERPTQCTKCSAIVPMSKNEIHRDECPSRILKCDHCSNYFKASYLCKVHDEARCRNVQLAIQKLKHVKPHLPLTTIQAGDVGTLLQAVRTIEIVQLSFLASLVRSHFIPGGGTTRNRGGSMGAGSVRKSISRVLDSSSVQFSHNDEFPSSSNLMLADESSVIDVDKLVVGLVDSPRGSLRNEGSLADHQQFSSGGIGGSGGGGEDDFLTQIGSSGTLDESGADYRRYSINTNNNTSPEPSSSPVPNRGRVGGGGTTGPALQQQHPSSLHRHTNALTVTAQQIVARYTHGLALPAALALFNEIRPKNSPFIPQLIIHHSSPQQFPQFLTTDNHDGRSQSPNPSIPRAPSVVQIVDEVVPASHNTSMSTSATFIAAPLTLAAVTPHLGVHIPISANQALQQQILRILTSFQNPHTIEAVHQVFISLPRWVPPCGFTFVDSIIASPEGPFCTTESTYKTIAAPTTTTIDLDNNNGMMGLAHTMSASNFNTNNPSLETVAGHNSSNNNNNENFVAVSQQQAAVASSYFTKANVEGISGIPMVMPPHIRPFDPLGHQPNGGRRHTIQKAANSSVSSVTSTSRKQSVTDSANVSTTTKRLSGVAAAASQAADATSTNNDEPLSLGACLPSGKPRVHLLTAPFQPCRGYVLSGGLQALASSIGEKIPNKSRPQSSAGGGGTTASDHSSSHLATTNTFATFTTKNSFRGGVVHEGGGVASSTNTSRPGTASSSHHHPVLPEAALNSLSLTPPSTSSFVTTTINSGSGQQSSMTTSTPPLAPASTTSSLHSPPSTSSTTTPSGGQWNAAVEITPVRPAHHPLYPPFLPPPPSEGSVVFITHVNDQPIGKFITKHIRGYALHLQHQIDAAASSHQQHHNNHRHSSTAAGGRTQRDSNNNMTDDGDASIEGGGKRGSVNNNSNAAIVPVVEVLEHAYSLLVENKGLPSAEELMDRYPESSRGDALCDILASLVQPMISHYIDQQGTNGIGQEVRIRVVATAAASYRQEVGFTALNTVYRRRFQDHFPQHGATTLFSAQRSIELFCEDEDSSGAAAVSHNGGGGGDNANNNSNLLIAYPPALAFELQYIIGSTETKTVEEYEALKFLMVSDMSQYCKPGTNQINKDGNVPAGGPGSGANNKRRTTR